MNIDDELRRLFADDRLDIAVRPDAERVIVAGACRVRRRRFVTATAGVVAVVALLGSGIAVARAGGHESLPPAVSTPRPTAQPTPRTPTTTSTTTPTATQPTTLDPTTEPSVATTLPPSTTSQIEEPKLDVVGPSKLGPLRLGMSERDALATGLLGPVEMGQDDTCTRYTGTFGGNVLVSAVYGVVRIAVTAPVATPEGIHLGSTVAEIRAAYPAARDYRMGLKAGTYAFIIGGPGDYYTPWPSTSTVVRIDIDARSDCMFAI